MTLLDIESVRLWKEGEYNSKQIVYQLTNNNRIFVTFYVTLFKIILVL